MQDKIILFDIGGTLLKPYDIEKFYNNVECKQTYRSFYKIYQNCKQASLLESGLITTDEYIEYFNKQLHLFLDKMKFIELFLKDNKREFYHNTYNFSLDLKNKGYKIGLLSNLRDINWFQIENDLDIKYFDYYFLSFQLHLLKPKREIYKKVIEVLNTNPANIYFFDDIEENVIAAKKVGINAFLVKEDNILDVVRENKLLF